MKKPDHTGGTIRILGSLGILSSLVMVIAGCDPMDCYFPFYSGVTLLGTVILENKSNIDKL